MATKDMKKTQVHVVSRHLASKHLSKVIEEHRSHFSEWRVHNFSKSEDATLIRSETTDGAVSLKK